MNTGLIAKEGAIGPVAVQADRDADDAQESLLAGLRGIDPALVLLFTDDQTRLRDLARGLRDALPPVVLSQAVPRRGRSGLAAIPARACWPSDFRLPNSAPMPCSCPICRGCRSRNG